MNNYENIKIIGFDLDQTLYPKSPEIDTAIQKYIYTKISELKKCSIEESTKLFKELYAKIGSGSKTLMEIGFEKTYAKEIIQEALEKADIEEFLVPNQEVIQLLKDLKGKYKSLSLITGSNKEITKKKLKKLEIKEEIFDFYITSEPSKSNGEAYKAWLKHYTEKDNSLKPENFLYIGDRKISDVDIPSTFGIKSVLVNVKKQDPEINVPQFTSLLDIREILL